MTPLIRARRILKHLAHFKMCEAGNTLSETVLNKLPQEERAGIIGWYDNDTGNSDDNVIITSNGLCVTQGEKWVFFSYKGIQGFAPIEKGSHASTVTIHLESGSIAVPITGGSFQFRDVFEFVRFLDRVQGDLCRT